MSGVCSRGMLGFPYKQETPIKNQKKKVHCTKLVKAWGCNSLKSMPKPQSCPIAVRKTWFGNSEFHVPFYRNIYIHPFTYTWMALDIPNLPYEWNTYRNIFVIWIRTPYMFHTYDWDTPQVLRGKKTSKFRIWVYFPGGCAFLVHG